MYSGTFSVNYLCPFPVAEHFDLSCFSERKSCNLLQFERNCSIISFIRKLIDCIKNSFLNMHQLALRKKIRADKNRYEQVAFRKSETTVS